MKNIEDWKYKDVPLENVTDDYGHVTDVEFAKYLIGISSVVVMLWKHAADLQSRNGLRNVIED